MVDPKLTTLLVLVRLENYTKTAKELNLTQPAITHHIKQLEQDYQITIFHRQGRNLLLTTQGEILVKFARRAVALEENCQMALLDAKSSVRRFSIGVTTTLSESIVPQVFALYCQRHPETKIVLLTETLQNIVVKLKMYELDWAIVEGSIPQRHYSSILLDTDELCLAVSPQHSLAARSSVTLEELRTEKFILRSIHAGTRYLFESALNQHGLSISDLDVLIEIDNVSTIKELVASNLGVTVIARSALREEIIDQRLVALSIENLSLQRQINMVYYRDFTHTEVLDEIKQIYDSLPNKR